MEPRLEFLCFTQSTGSRTYRGFRYWTVGSGDSGLSLVLAWWEGQSEMYATDGSAEALEQIRTMYREIMGVTEIRFESFRKA